jgi:diguanylate cyclase (GGDEF)-like protein
MHHALASLTLEHDHRLVILAVSLGVFGAIAAMRVLQLAMASAGSRRLTWLIGAALVGGSTIWAAHFISILAYRPGVEIGYNIVPTLQSLVIGVFVAGLTFAATLREEKWAPFAAGSLLGCGIAAMHYIGIGGLQVPGVMVWNPDLVVLSILSGILFGMLALVAIRTLPNERGLLSGSVALACSVLVLHFAGMGAMRFIADPGMSVAPSPVPAVLLASAVAVATCFVLTIALTCVVFDKRMTKGRDEAEQKIRHLAYHDPLTGLPNRAALGETLREYLDTAAAKNSQVALLALDLDRFKQVNDIFGHQAGDGLLRILSDVMSAELKPNEMVARVGGDEFVVVQRDVPQPEGADELAKRLLKVVCRDVDVEGVTFRAATSIGIAIYPRDGMSAAVLHPNADAALYRAKQEGRGGYRFFEPEMDLQLRERRALQLEMRDALKRNEFKVYYQPQAETMTGVISGFEALIRWDHPKRGLIAPVEFIPAAEENGFIVELGEFVLRTAAAEASSWKKPLTISVNLSPVQFQHGDLVGLVQNVLTETGLDPKRLELEITEGVLILDFSRALAMLKSLKELGVCIAMDDFGTGYSSLAYLQAFPFDHIKIDRSFIASLDTNKQSEAIIRAVVGLGRGLDVPVTAEGVETEEQQAFLAELDCAGIQGYLIGKPQPIELLEAHVGRVPDAAKAAVA